MKTLSWRHTKMATNKNLYKDYEGERENDDNEFEVQGMTGCSTSNVSRPISDVSKCTDDCTQFLNTALEYLYEWLANQTKPWSKSDMFSYLQFCIAQDIHGHLGELAQVCDIINSFASHLKNMFDNYTCFYGEEDEKRMQNFIEKAWSQTLKDFKSKCFLHVFLLENFLTEACGKLNQIVLKHNSKIVRNEEMLADHVKREMVNMLKRSLKKPYLPVTLKSLDKIASQIQTNLVNIMANCLDDDGKLNQVHATYSQKMLAEINEEISSFKARLNNKPNCQSSDVLNSVGIYYKAALNKDMYENPQNFSENEIYKHHDISTEQALSTLLSQEDKADTYRIILCHLIHIISRRYEKSRESFLRTNQFLNQTKANTLSLYFTVNSIRIDIKQKDSAVSVKFLPENQVWCPALMILDDNDELIFGFEAYKILTSHKKPKKLHNGNVDRFIRDAAANEEQAQKYLVLLLQNLRSTAQSSFRQKFSKAIILVPSWYNEMHIKRLICYSKDANFLDSFVLRENSVVAYKLIESLTQTGKSGLAVSFDVGADGIYVDIFGKSEENDGSVELLGRSFSVISHENIGNDSTEFAEKLVKMKTAFKKANNLLQTDLNNVKKYCFLLVDDEEWKKIFECFVNELQNAIVVQNPRDIYGAPGAVSFSDNPHKIRDYIIDYMRVRVLSETDENVSGFRNNEQTAINIDESCREEVKVVATVYDNNQRREKQKELLKICRNMRKMMETGEVKVGRLFLKDVMEALERAEEVATNEFSSISEIENVIAEIIELIEEHEFNI